MNNFNFQKTHNTSKINKSKDKSDFKVIVINNKLHFICTYCGNSNCKTLKGIRKHVIKCKQLNRR